VPVTFKVTGTCLFRNPSRRATQPAPSPQSVLDWGEGGGRGLGRGWEGIVPRKMDGKGWDSVSFGRIFLKLIEDFASTFCFVGTERPLRKDIPFLVNIDRDARFCLTNLENYAKLALLLLSWIIKHRYFK